jgi:hypothetical protein
VRRAVAALVAVALCSALARPVEAQQPQAPEPARDPKEAKAAEKRKDDKPNPAGTTLAVTGTSLMGLGAATLFASGICWIIASAEASRLDEECPNKQCVEGSMGARSLRTARDTERAGDITFGVGMPVLATGFVLVLMASGLSRKNERRTISAAPVVSESEAGGVVGVSF